MHGGLEPLGGGQGLEGGVYAFDHTKRIKRLEGKKVSLLQLIQLPIIYYFPLSPNFYGSKVSNFANC